MKLYNKLMIAGGILVYTGIILILVANFLSARFGSWFLIIGIVLAASSWFYNEWRYPYPWEKSETLDDKIWSIASKIVDEKLKERR